MCLFARRGGKIFAVSACSIAPGECSQVGSATQISNFCKIEFTVLRHFLIPAGRTN
jgi:hypothetical protein